MRLYNSIGPNPKVVRMFMAAILTALSVAACSAFSAVRETRRNDEIANTNRMARPAPMRASDLRANAVRNAMRMQSRSLSELGMAAGEWERTHDTRPLK